MDIISLPNHIFDSAPTNASVTEAAEKLPATTGANNIPDPSSSASMSFLPDRLSMHGTWCAQQLDGNSNEAATAPSARILIAICRRKGLLQIYDNPLAPSSSPLIEFPSSSSASLPIWQSNGCSHGTAILGESPSSVHTRRPENEVEGSEIRFFVAGPSLLSSESISGGTAEGRRQADAEKDAWMLRSLCLLVDTSYGDLHLYSASKRLSSNGLRLEFSRVPLSNVTRPSEEQNRHLTKLRRKGIVPPSSAAAAEVFRPNRLIRFCRISGEDGLFAATPRPLWFVAERGAMTVVSHKSRHVSPAGTRPVPISGFCTAMPDVFEVSSASLCLSLNNLNLLNMKAKYLEINTEWEERIHHYSRTHWASWIAKAHAIQWVRYHCDTFFLLQQAPAICTAFLTVSCAN